jgi:muramoyltetrapeptide carboxypeptidase LdcA involved in peptidoglycan recycling
MPTMRKFSLLKDSDWNALHAWLEKRETQPPWSKKKLSFWTSPPLSPVNGRLVGGNLTVWNSLLGTPYQPKADGCILFFEDIDESMYRIDRMLQQLLLSGSLNQIRGIVLGNFMNCKDGAPWVLKEVPSSKKMNRVLNSPKPSELQPLRKVMKEKDALRKIFTEFGERLQIPVAFGLPVGHGPEVSPLPLGAEYRLHPNGLLELVNWDWIPSSHSL